MFKTTITILVASVILYCCNTASSEPVAPEDSLQYYPPTPATIDKQEFRNYYRKVSSFFDSTLLRNGFNGGILIAMKGQIIYEKYQGLVDLRKTDSLTDSTSVHIASTGKTFTGMAVLRLVQENKLSLDDSLTRFFPGIPYPGITVKMLLNHRSGLPNYVYFIEKSGWDKKTYATNEDMVRILYDHKPARNFPADKRFSYSNTNYVLLAMIIEKVTGRSFAEYMQQKFFGPLQMKHTYVFTLKDTLTATPSFTGTGTFWENDFLDATYGDKNIYSTPRDLLKWDQALYTDQVIRPTLLDSAFIGYSQERPSVHNYGLGWRLQFLPTGKKVVYHFGKWHGFNAAFARLMDEQATIIVLGNKFNRSIYRAALQSYDIFGNYNQHDTDEYESDSATTRQPVIKNPGGLSSKTAR